GLRHEVDQFLDPADECGLQVVPVTHAAPDPLPRPRDVRLLGVRPAQLAAHALLPVRALGDDGPRLNTDAAGLDGLPDVDERVAQDERVRAARSASYRVGDPRFLGAGHEVVDEHTQPSSRPRLEVLDDRSEIVDTTEVFDDDALDAEVVAPHLLD